MTLPSRSRILKRNIAERSTALSVSSGTPSGNVGSGSAPLCVEHNRSCGISMKNDSEISAVNSGLQALEAVVEGGGKQRQLRRENEPRVPVREAPEDLGVV